MNPLRPSIVRTINLLLISGVLVGYALVFGQQARAAWHFPEWLIAPIMALGSFVAGATFLGGGAIAFPALTKILHTEPQIAKTFSLAIQSVGMTSASIYILLRVNNLPWRFMLLFLPGAFAGTTLSLVYVEQLFAAGDLKISFTLFLLVFLCVYLWVYRDRKEHYADIAPLTWLDKNLIVKAGFVGGLLSGLLGSGADVVGFCLLAIYFRLDIKLATQCSVLLMAATSLYGISWQLLTESIPHQIIPLWLIAAPVVVLGAPVGAIFCRRVQPRYLLIFICAIVLSELVSTVLLVPVALNKLANYALLVCLSAVLLLYLHKISKQKSHQGQHRAP